MPDAPDSTEAFRVGGSYEGEQGPGVAAGPSHAAGEDSCYVDGEADLSCGPAPGVPDAPDSNEVGGVPRGGVLRRGAGPRGRRGTKLSCR